MNEFSLIYIIIAGVVAGFIMGFSISSNTEMKERQINSAARRHFDIFPKTSLFKAIFNSLYPALVPFLIAFGVMFVILEVSESRPVSQSENTLLVMVWLVFTLLSKYLRYYCWKNYWKKKLKKYSFDDWNVDHQSPWSQCDLVGKNRKQILDNYNGGTRLEYLSRNGFRGTRSADL